MRERISKGMLQTMAVKNATTTDVAAAYLSISHIFSAQTMFMRITRKQKHLILTGRRFTA